MTFLLCAALLATPRLPHGKPAPDVSGQPVQQLSPEQVREKVDAYLHGIDTPVTDAQWRALGPQAGDLLESIATDAKAFPSRRARAVEGLTVAAPDRAARVAGSLARDEKQPVVVRVAAMRGVGMVLPPDQAARELKPVLQSARSPGMRREAADVMSSKRAGCAAVREQAGRERPEHREAWKDLVARCAE